MIVPSDLGNKWQQAILFLSAIPLFNTYLMHVYQKTKNFSYIITLPLKPGSLLYFTLHWITSREIAWCDGSMTFISNKAFNQTLHRSALNPRLAFQFCIGSCAAWVNNWAAISPIQFQISWMTRPLFFQFNVFWYAKLTLHHHIWQVRLKVVFDIKWSNHP